MSYIYIYIFGKTLILSILHVFNLTDVCDSGAERCKIEPFFYFALNNANAQSLTNNHKRFFFFFFLKCNSNAHLLSYR